jgi:thiamine biosynthesis protein ThiS
LPAKSCPFFGEILLKLTINGESREILKSQNLEDLISELDIQAPNIAMALNQQVVPRSKYATTPIQENDQVEIVHAVGGGI